MKETWLETDLLSFPTELEMKDDVFIRSEKQNRIILKVFKGGVPYALSGSASVLFMRPNGVSTEINQNASISGNRLIFDLPDMCYEQDGRIALALIDTLGSVRTTLALIRGTVYATRT